MVTATKKQALVVGLGETGYSCVDYLLGAGYTVSVADSRDVPPKMAQLTQHYKDVVLHTGEYSGELFVQQDLLVVSPGVSLQQSAIQQALQQGVEIVGDVELFAREARAPVLAITGTNGKSTVTALLGAMVEQAGHKVEVAGNIGVPVLQLLQKPVPDFYVLELSSFQLETTSSLQPRVATILNICPDHLDRYDSIEVYAEAKYRIFNGAESVVVNLDDARVMQGLLPGQAYTGFSSSAPQRDSDYGFVDQQGETWLARGSESLVATSALALKGRHNHLNILAALAMGEAIGLSLSDMLQAATQFAGLPHRNQVIRQHNAVTWIDDSKATNVGAAVAALQGQTQPVILIAGGEAKENDFSALQQAVKDHARAVILIGRDAAILQQGLQGSVELHQAGDMFEAVRQAQQLAQAGDVVLLAPACASFDMFRNYMHRGEVFREAVEEVTG